jgi:RHS repeat-associated protein
VNSTYTYDAAGRLTRIQDGTMIDVQYTLDAAGQVAMAGFNAPLDPAVLITNTQSSPFIYDAAHQINSAGFNYDARGRLIASPGNTFTWDGASRLTGIGAVALSYNGLGDLITRTEGGATTRYFYNYAVGLAPIMAERNETTMQVQRYYVWTPGGRLLYLIDAANGNAVRHYHVDRVGSTLALTSAAGAVTDAYAYTPYGELLGRTGTSAQPFTYVGAYGVRSEPAADLYHMRARYYDPLSARFLSREPIWPVLGQPRGLDPYQYAYGEPMRYMDRTGLSPTSVGDDPPIDFQDPKVRRELCRVNHGTIVAYLFAGRSISDDSPFCAGCEPRIIRTGNIRANASVASVSPSWQSRSDTFLPIANPPVNPAPQVAMAQNSLSFSVRDFEACLQCDDADANSFTFTSDAPVPISQDVLSTIYNSEASFSKAARSASDTGASRRAQDYSVEFFGLGSCPWWSSVAGPAPLGQ